MQGAFDPIKPWLIDTSPIVLKGSKPLATGATGAVYKIEYNGHDFAAKAIRTINEGSLNSYISEIVALSELQHPSIIQLVGATLNEEVCFSSSTLK